MGLMKAAFVFDSGTVVVLSGALRLPPKHCNQLI
jgi:hypothetical protein